jgi:hypothetical protein
LVQFVIVIQGSLQNGVTYRRLKNPLSPHHTAKFLTINSVFLQVRPGIQAEAVPYTVGQAE